ncbi:MAG: ClpXP protease specificity-enhancing factor [Pseudomonadota bacterium]
MNLPSTKPYLIRAIHEWCCENGFTPYIAVTVNADTQVPKEFVRDGQIVLNIDYDASNQLTMGNEYIVFQARFGGVARDISVPIGAISAIYARENGVGMAFEPEPEPEHVSEAPEPEPPSPPPAGRPKFQRIK